MPPQGSGFMLISSTGMMPSSLDRTSYAAAASSWLCKDCSAPRAFVESVNIRIQEEEPIDEPLTLVSGCGLFLARQDLLDILGGDHVCRDLLCGTVTNRHGRTLPDWKTVRGRRQLIVRGSEHVGYRRCTTCGRLCYFAMGSRYLYPRPADDASIYGSDLGLIVAPGILDADAFARWPQIVVDMLPTPDEPMDALGDLPYRI